MSEKIPKKVFENNITNVYISISRGSKFKILYNSSSPINILYVLFPKLSATLLPAKLTTHVISAFQRSFLSTSIQVLMSTKGSIGTRHSTLLLSKPVLKL